MSLADDLLVLAGEMANGGASQARLRRTISTAYYSLFHLLIESAGAAVADRPELARTVGRSLAHGEMLKVARWFEVGSGGLPAFLHDPYAPHSAPVTAEIMKVASAFVLLLKERQAADYDSTRTYSQADADDLVEETRQAFAAWKTVLADPAQGPARELFSLALLFGERLKR